MSAATLDDQGAHVRLDYDGPAHATAYVVAEPTGGSSRAAGVLVRGAIAAARRRRTRRVETALEARGPACGIVLDALRDQVGRDIAHLTLRRAGSTVFVTIDLAPPDAAGH